MFYTFVRQTSQEISFEDVLYGNTTRHAQKISFITINTEYDKNVPESVKEAMESVGLTISTFIEGCPNYEDLYDTFRIPKRTGGFREIEAPQETLSILHQIMKNKFETGIKALPHDSAHAYVRTRGTVTANQVHQRNESNWFLKMDLKDFFPSCNFEFIYNQLSKIFPFSQLIREERYDTILRNIIKICLRNDRLPQGTKMSPMLTNLVMVPIDYAIREALGPQYRYTRYADDLLISSRVKFNPEEVENKIKEILEPTPLKIKDEKTRFQSKAGKNWNLGIMLNKDNQLTIGHKKKERFRAALYNLIKDTQNNVPWDVSDIQHLQGMISYYNMVEPEFIRETLQKYNQKYNVNIKQIMKDTLNY